MAEVHSVRHDARRPFRGIFSSQHRRHAHVFSVSGLGVGERVVWDRRERGFQERALVWWRHSILFIFRRPRNNVRKLELAEFSLDYRTLATARRRSWHCFWSHVSTPVLMPASELFSEHSVNTPVLMSTAELSSEHATIFRAEPFPPVLHVLFCSFALGTIIEPSFSISSRRPTPAPSFRG